MSQLYGRTLGVIIKILQRNHHKKGIHEKPTKKNHTFLVLVLRKQNTTTEHGCLLFPTESQLPQFNTNLFSHQSKETKSFGDLIEV